MVIVCQGIINGTFVHYNERKRSPLMTILYLVARNKSPHHGGTVVLSKAMK